MFHVKPPERPTETAEPVRPVTAPVASENAAKRGTWPGTRWRAAP